MTKFALLLLLAGAPVLAASPKLESADAGAAPTCGSKTCTPPETCIKVTGKQRNSSRMGCWIQCSEEKTCPAGLTCTMIHDGPGHVCLKKD